MDKSLFENKAEFDKYLNKILATQGTTLSDKLLHLFLWEKIKLLLQYDDTVKEKYLDNENKILFLEDENGDILIGYHQIDRKWDKNSKEDSMTIIKELKHLIDNIRKLAKEKLISSYRCMIVSTFKLSNFYKGVFSILADDIGYFYLIDIDKDGGYHFDLNR